MHLYHGVNETRKSRVVEDWRWVCICCFGYLVLISDKACPVMCGW